MYKAAISQSGGNFRPWNARLGDYKKATFYVPTPTVAYGGEKVTGGLGLDLSSLTSNPLALAVGGFAVWYLFFRKR